MNILVFTNHYPFKDRDCTATKAVHYFTKEWIKQGHHVVVVHNHISLVNFFNITKRKRDSDSYVIDGVKILYCPINRYIPKSDYILKNEVEKAKKEILNFLESENFSPDKFVVHFCAEQWQIVEAIRLSLDCTPIPIFHNCDVKSDKRIKKIVTSSNKIGYRSDKIKNKILSVINTDIEVFQVFSGAPDYSFDEKQIETNFEETGKKRLLYVGNFIPIKRIDITIKALAELKNKYDFVFNIIGSGKSESFLKRLVIDLGLDENVNFLPRMSRYKVLDIMRKSDCFIMVSQPETLGIVYIEAMANGCFVIGSKGEGIDGIIVNNESGLLVQPGNIDALTKALTYYFKLLPDELDEILKRSGAQALRYKESNVARDYLNSL